MNIHQKSAYYSDKTFRAKEIQAQAQAIPQETAFAHVIERLQEYALTPYTLTVEQQQALLKLLCELQLEQVRQTQTIDYRSISSFKEAYRQAIDQERQIVYNGLCIQKWESVKQNYKAIGKLAIDLGEYVVEPVLLDPHGEKVVKGWGIEPTDGLAVVRCFNVRDEAFSLRTWADTAKLGISCGHLHAFTWNLEVYNRTPEAIYHSFKQWVEGKLSEFREEHGGLLTPELTFKVSDVMKQVVGGDLFLVGWRVTVKALQEEAKPKKGLLDRLTNML